MLQGWVLLVSSEFQRGFGQGQADVARRFERKICKTRRLLRWEVRPHYGGRSLLGPDPYATSGSTEGKPTNDREGVFTQQRIQGNVSKKKKYYKKYVNIFLELFCTCLGMVSGHTTAHYQAPSQHLAPTWSQRVATKLRARTSTRTQERRASAERESSSKFAYS